MPRCIPNILCCASLALVLVAPALVAAEWDPVSRLSRPPRGGPMYITVAGGGGSVAAGDQMRPGYSLAAILRPHRAEDFLRGAHLAEGDRLGASATD